MDRRYMIYGAVALAVFGGWYFLKNRNSSTSNVPNQYQPPALQSTDFQSNATLDNAPWEMTWPYNQLALPYDYNAQNAQLVSTNTDFLSPQNPNYVGYNPTVVTVG